ncbi:hypothetical protein FJO69_00510 [[Mycoplasma] falconis]|uniref:Uncharacterized protein n=1 Tax=[Mycoplasma] falconis TaxID=92403 RepID=A0A501XC66_9BACT|nr:hypothetical protein [[Mycoplasma] falconis]TPE58076.1 hypothetical protein FJO69_00510 [[Mycoplasma] falconis]
MNKDLQTVKTAYILNIVAIAILGLFFPINIAAIVFTGLSAAIKNQKEETKILLWVGFGVSFVCPLVGFIISLVGSMKLKEELTKQETK